MSYVMRPSFNVIQACVPDNQILLCWWSRAVQAVFNHPGNRLLTPSRFSSSLSPLAEYRCSSLFTCHCCCQLFILYKGAIMRHVASTGPASSIRPVHFNLEPTGR
ncbi:hypothetical protein HD806DRAFT_389857 [Xylariaceae sp. AK1471]|nr:hypothetical protein HD806DRAFT_389857 [Xylariaceae sp. AK1471]